MMKAKYKKYYDALKGKDFSGGISKMSSAVDATETGIAQMQSSMSASGWTELGAITINNTTIPNMVLDVRLIKFSPIVVLAKKRPTRPAPAISSRLLALLMPILVIRSLLFQLALLPILYQRLSRLLS